MKIKFIFILLTLLVMGCSKEESNGPGIQALDCRIIRDNFIFDNDTNNTSGTEYIYSAGRLESKRNVNSINDQILYQYNNLGQLSSILSSFSPFSPPDTINKFYYDQLNKLVKIVSYFDSSTEAEIQFKYANSKLSELYSIYEDTITERYRLVTDDRNNIREAILIESNSILAAPGSKLVFKYDNFKNPFQGVYDENQSIIQYFASNNLIRFETYEQNVLTDFGETSLQYNVHGYPISFFEQEIDFTSLQRIEYECYSK